VFCSVQFSPVEVGHHASETLAIYTHCCYGQSSLANVATTSLAIAAPRHPRTQSFI